jgi:hypothetical protein
MSLSLADGSWELSDIGDMKFVRLARHSERNPMTKKQKSVARHLDNIVVKPIQVATVTRGGTFAMSSLITFVETKDTSKSTE